MFYKKKGFPEKGEIVICTVKKVLFHSVFAVLDEYIGKEGLIHISEVSPGRIRTIRDYVKEGKKVVCKVLNVDERKGHIDLSLRRVNNAQRIQKNREYKQEQKAERLLEQIGKELKKDLDVMYKEIGYKLIEMYGNLFDGFQSLVADPDLIKEFKLQKKIEQLLLDRIKIKIKIPEVTINGMFNLTNDKPDGAEIIKKILLKVGKNKGIKISYISAPRYKMYVTAGDYKTAEDILKKASDKILEEMKKEGGSAKFIRK